LTLNKNNFQNYPFSKIKKLHTFSFLKHKSSIKDKNRNERMNGSLPGEENVQVLRKNEVLRKK
jgi:hypothetical protein